MKIQFWPADYFAIQMDTLTVSEPVAGQVRVTWQACRGHDRVDLYVRQHATDWPTLDGLENGELNPAYKIDSFLVLPTSITSVLSPVPATTGVWTNTGYTNGQVVRAIAVPYGRFGYSGSRMTGSLTMQNSTGPALINSGATYLDDRLGDGVDSPSLDGVTLYVQTAMSRTSVVSDSGHDVEIEVLDFYGNWVPAWQEYKIDGSFAYSAQSYDRIPEAATVNNVIAQMIPYVIVYPHDDPVPLDVPRVHLGVTVKLVPQGGGAAIDMLVYHFYWTVR